jgi:hypothetical protein
MYYVNDGKDYYKMTKFLWFPYTKGPKIVK